MNTLDIDNLTEAEIVAELDRISHLLGSQANTIEMVAQGESSTVVEDTTIELDAGDELQTIYIGNRVELLSSYQPGATAVFIAGSDMPEFQRLMLQLSETQAQVARADTESVTLGIEAGNARRSLNSYTSSLIMASDSVSMARRDLEAAQARLAAAEKECLSQENAFAARQKEVLHIVRRAGIAESKADELAYRSMQLAAKARRCLIDGETGVMDLALLQLGKRVAAMNSDYATITEFDAALSRLPKKFIFGEPEVRG